MKLEIAVDVDSKQDWRWTLRDDANALAERSTGVFRNPNLCRKAAEEAHPGVEIAYP